MNVLGVFAKYWEPGQVKTRLAASIGPEMAAAVYRSFVVTLLERFGHLADRRLLVYSPPEQQRAFALIAGDNWQLQQQSNGDMGQRMEQFFSSAFEKGANRVVLIGSDSPDMPSERITAAFDRLADSSVVLGPAEDGGYYLVGASRSASQKAPPIFDHIDWSSEHVWRQTLERLQACNIEAAELPIWYDIDTADDLGRLSQQIGQQAVIPKEDKFALLRQTLKDIVPSSN